VIRPIGCCAFLLALGFGAAHAVCPPSGLERSGLDEFRKNGFAIEDEARRNALALELLDCVGDPDPALRDGLAFETIQQRLRERALAAETLLALSRLACSPFNVAP
jgi:hypothetical protein